MKKIIFSILFLVALAFGAEAQTYIPVLGHWEYRFFRVDSVLTLPHYTTANRPAPGGINQIIVNDDSAKLQYTVGSSWVTLNGTSTAGSLTPAYGIKLISTTISWDSANVRKQDSSWIAGDTLEFRINGGQTYKYQVALSKVKYTDTAAMLAPYIRSILAVKYSDTSSMLSPYLRSILGVKYTDTAAMLSPYLRSNLGLKYSDSAAMLSPYAQKIFLNLKIDSITRKPGNDTVYQWHNGIKVFAFLDSIGAGGGGCVGCLAAANNLSDVASVATARANLALGTAALQNNAFFLQSANNLSDVASVATSRTNLGLGTAAQQNNAFFLQSANNLSDIGNAATARTNLGLGVIAQRSTLTNADLSGSAGITNANLANSTITIDGTPISLGGSISNLVKFSDTVASNGIATQTMLRANISYFTYSDLTLGTLNPDSIYAGGFLIRDAHHSGSNLYNHYFDSTNVIMTGTGYAMLPKGTTAQRPSSPVVGWIRYNTDSADYERYHGAGVWNVFGSGSGGSTLATASGDATGTVSGTNLPLTLATVNSNTGSFGDATHVPQVTLNGKGLVTAASSVAITGLISSLTTTGTSGAATYSAGTLNIPQYSGGGSSFTRQVITTGTSATVTGGKYIVTFDPSSVISSYTLTLPASPSDMDEVEIEAGGTITGGAPVITTLTISPNSGQTIHQAIVPTTINDGEVIKYRYRTSNTAWYRKL